MFVNIFNVMMASYPISEWEMPFSMRMIGAKLIQNNNIICIFFEKIKLFQLSKYNQWQWVLYPFCQSNYTSPLYFD